MKKLIFGLIIGLILSSSVSYAYRIGKPLRITDFDQKGLVVINENFERLFDLTNGRYSLNITTTNPDGNTTGDVGDMLLYNNSGTYYLAINTTGAKIWRSVLLQDTP